MGMLLYKLPFIVIVAS